MSEAQPTAYARAWVLNLDAELELMRPRNYHPTKGSLAACEHYSPLAKRLLRGEDRELSRTEPLRAGCALGYLGHAWCPTPSAVALLERAGAVVQHAPSLNCLQQVNHRRFHAELGQTLPEAGFVTSLPDALDKLARPSPLGWMVKRGFGFASRGVRRMPAQLTRDDANWLTQALTYGGIQIEPWLELLAEYSLHGYVTNTGVQLGQPCRLTLGAEPKYTQVSRAECGDDNQALAPAERARLFQQAELTAAALKASGYTGPFGIDAFAYLYCGQREFNPRSEVNARYTLAYSVGMSAFLA